VLGLEVSRLARNSSDWHRLLEICAFTQALILDEDGVNDPAHFNDRLLLGLKGTISEAELHVLRARLQGLNVGAAINANARDVTGASIASLLFPGREDYLRYNELWANRGGENVRIDNSEPGPSLLLNHHPRVLSLSPDARSVVVLLPVGETPTA
jgi:Resolvase, N terminal domain